MSAKFIEIETQALCAVLTGDFQVCTEDKIGLLKKAGKQFVVLQFTGDPMNAVSKLMHPDGVDKYVTNSLNAIANLVHAKHPGGLRQLANTDNCAYFKLRDTISHDVQSVEVMVAEVKRLQGERRTKEQTLAEAEQRAITQNVALLDEQIRLKREDIDLTAEAIEETRKALRARRDEAQRAITEEKKRKESGKDDEYLKFLEQITETIDTPNNEDRNPTS